MTPIAINLAITDATGISGAFYSDLNAIHEVEKLLRPPYWKDYSIWQIYLNYLEEDPHATALQRAKAFLLTLGKWKDSDA